MRESSKSLFVLIVIGLSGLICCQQEEMVLEKTPASSIHVSVEPLSDSTLTYSSAAEIVHWIGSHVSRYTKSSDNDFDYNYSGNIEEAFVSSTPLSDAVILSPFDSKAKCAAMKSGEYKVTDIRLPETMVLDDILFTYVAVSSPNDSLRLLHTCGAANLKLTGNATIKTIKVKANNDEALSGPAEIKAHKNGAPQISLSDKGTVINIDCGKKGIKLSEDKSTDFLIPLPPARYSSGLTFYLKSDSSEENVALKTKPINIERAKICIITDSITTKEEKEEDEQEEDSDENKNDPLEEYDPNYLVNILDVGYDGYNVRINVPQTVTGETGPGTDAIRYTQACIMMYNYMKNHNDYFYLLYNGGNYVIEDKVIEYSESTNRYWTGTDKNGDGQEDWKYNYNPISPGEPVVFVAGEFSWMEDTPEYKNEFFKLPLGWDSGYYMPLINPEYYENNVQQSSMNIIDWDYTHPLDAYWTGAFQRKHFRIKEPELLEAGVEIKLSKVTPVNATLEFYPEEGVDQYAFGIFDENTYQNQILPLLNNNPDYMQWAVTSYFAAYTLGTKVTSGAVQADLTSFFYQSAIQPETKYTVFVTAMGNPQGTTQSFQTFDFETTARTLPAPVVKVTPLEDATTPFKATFNIKCTTYADNPLMEAYYAANYLRDWRLATNGGSTYFSLLNGSYQFSAAELSAINSEKGYTISFPSVDGETTRLAVLGYNTEYLPNDVTSYKAEQIDEGECPAIADVTTPWAKTKEPRVDPAEYKHLAGVWTATATLQSGTNSKKIYDHSSKITISMDLYDYPAFSDNIYKIYEEAADMDKTDVDAYWTEFEELARTFTNNRLVRQNRLLCLGWLDDDSYGRLSARSPYDLLVAKDYTSVDVSSIYNDFGPKWYIEAVQDSKGNISFIAPVDMNQLPPAANWATPFYFFGMEVKNYSAIAYSEEGTLCFPVEFDEGNKSDSADDKIIIKPFVHESIEYYPNMIGIDYAVCENPIVSEIVLTRGWSETDYAQSSLGRSKGRVKAGAELPTTVYKRRTPLKSPSKEIEKIEYQIVSEDEFRKRADELVRRTLGYQ